MIYVNERCGSVEIIEFRLLHDWYMLSVDEYGNGEKNTICIRSKAIQVAFLRICVQRYFAALHTAYHSPWTSFFSYAGPSSRRCRYRAAVLFLLSNIRQRDRQIQKFIEKLLFYCTLRKNLNIFMAEKNKISWCGWTLRGCGCAAVTVGNRMKTS